MRRLIKIFLMLMATILLLLVITVSIVQTRWARQLIIALIAENAPNFINGSIIIDNISGSLWGDVVLHDIALLDKTDTIATVARTEIDFEMLPLLGKKIVVNLVSISEARLKIATDSINGLNLSQLIIESDDKQESEMSVSISIRELIIDDLAISMAGFNPPVPEKIDDIHLAASFDMDRTNTSFSIDSLSALPGNGWPELKKLAVKININNSTINISDFIIHSTKNKIRAEALYQTESDFNAGMNIRNPNVEEFKFLLPSITFAKLDSVDVYANNIHNKLFFGLYAGLKNQEIAIKGSLDAFNQIFSDNQPTPFNVEAKLEGVNVAQWITSIDGNIVINGTIAVDGQQLMPGTSPITVKADLDGTSFNNFKAEKLKINSSITDTNLKVKIWGSQNNQGIEAAIISDSWMTKNYFRGFINVTDIDALQYPGSADVQFKSGTFSFNGNGLTADELTAKITGRILSPVIYGTRCDSLLLSVSSSGQKIDVDTISIFIPDAYLAANGSFTGSDKSIMASVIANGDFSYAINDSSKIETKESHLNAKLWGNLDTIDWEGRIYALNLGYDSIAISGANISTQGRLVQMKPSASVNMKIDKITYGNLCVNTTSISGNYNDKTAGFDIKTTTSDSIRLAAKATVIQGDTTKITIPKIQIDALGYSIANRDTAKLKLAELSVITDSLIFDYKDKANHHLFSAIGKIDPLGYSDFRLVSGRIPLSLLSPFIGNNSLAGDASLSIHLTGSPNNHKLSIETEADSITYEGIQINKLRQSGILTNNRMNLKSDIINKADEAISVSVTSDHLLKQDSLKFMLIKKPDLVIESQANRVPLRYLIPPGTGYDVSKGLLSYQIKIWGDTEKPYSDGYIRIDDAALKVAQAGANFNKINMMMRLDKSTIVLDTLLIGSGQGKMQLTGNAAFIDGLLSPVKSIDISIDADRFRLNRRNLFDITFDADAKISAVDAIPMFDGRINIVSSNLDVDGIMNVQSGPKKYRDDILLVSSLKNLRGIKQEETEVITETSLPSTPFLYTDKLKGKLKILMPHNTWLKGESMGLELRGDLDLMIEGKDFEIFGLLSVNRGFYNLYGRKLQITTGELTFSGGKELNPSLNIIAEYKFRSSDREKRTLTANIGGNLQRPEISFLLDDGEITQGDAIGYLVFGKPMSELGSGVNQLGGNQTDEALSGMISSQLSKLLASSLDLDIVEIDANENWENTSFVVGKYIASNLFVIYQRSFGKSTDNEISKQKIILEYELNRHLFFRLESGDERTSGVDLILKKESKK